jgi:hypothetical protein
MIGDQVPIKPILWKLARLVGEFIRLREAFPLDDFELLFDIGGRGRFDDDGEIFDRCLEIEATPASSARLS